SVVMTNKSLTGPNRGYACGHLYFETEGMMDRLAEKLGLDPAEVRRRNLIPPDELPYRTPTGGYYDSGDYPKTLQMALATARHDAPGPGPPDDRVADHRRRARAQAPGHHRRRRDGHVHPRVVDLVGDVLEPLRIGGDERSGAGGAQAEGQARGVRGAPDGRARQRRRVQGRRRQAEARQGPVLHREGSGRARPLEHGV